MAWNLQKSMYKEVAQTLQESRKSARSIENVSGSLQPLSEGSELNDLMRIESLALEISQTFTKLYNGIAAKAFGAEGYDGREVRGGPTQA